MRLDDFYESVVTLYEAVQVLVIALLSEGVVVVDCVAKQAV